jgi:UDP-glucose 4-epimerase
MKVTVLGGSGFLGSHVADELSKRGHKVIIFDKKKSKWIRSDQKMFIGNILNPNDLENVIKNTDVVFHFAALADLDQALKNPINTVKVNILGTVQALELCRKHNIKRFIHASTIYVNSSEGGFYRSSKKAAEDYVREYKKNYNLSYTIIRFGSLYGRRADDTNGVRKIIKRAIAKGKLTYVGNRKSVREYINISDAAKACCEILKNKYKNKHIILTGTKKIKVFDFLNRLSKILNISQKIEFRNLKFTGRYIAIPYTYKPEKGVKFVFKSASNFYEKLPQLVNEIKRN